MNRRQQCSQIGVNFACESNTKFSVTIDSTEMKNLSVKNKLFKLRGLCCSQIWCYLKKKFCLKCIWNDVWGKGKTISWGIIVSLFGFKPFLFFNDWLFHHEAVIFCKGIMISLVNNLCNRLIGKVPWFLE